MCVIIYKPKGVTISERNLKLCWEHNSDGAGVVIPGKSPAIFKGLMTLETLMRTLNHVGKREAVIHLRMATHGKAVASNTHPFECGRGRFLMHNGVLSRYGSYGLSGHSDSKHFAKDLQPLKTDAVKRLLDTVPGRFAFVDRTKVTLHGNFIEHSGAKYSNLNWVPVPAIPAKAAAFGTPVYATFTNEDDEDRYPVEWWKSYRTQEEI